MNPGPEEDYGRLTGPAEITLTRLLPGPIERVWAYLTEPAKRSKWLAGGEIELRVGGKAELRFDHDQISPEPTPEEYKGPDARCDFEGRVTRCEPPRVLSHTWGSSEVTFELTPKGGQVLLVLTHRKLGDRDELASVASGWHAHAGILMDNLYGREPRGFWSAHARLEEAYLRMLPADAGTEGKAI